jgi:hypothetical protein
MWLYSGGDVRVMWGLLEDLFVAFAVDPLDCLVRHDGGNQGLCQDHS